ncbi:MAG: malto-oligosyltrehalose trehalohydrolase [Candidatus Rokuibacteriota bacterium]
MESLGASLKTAETEFRVWAPHCRSVEVLLDRRAPVPLQAAADGLFEGVLPDAHAGSTYWYRLDGARDRPDPLSRYQPMGVHGPSMVVDPRDFAWTDQAFRGHALDALVIYELHVGTFTELGTFEAVIPHLAALVDLGVSAVELMPVAEFPGGRDWGYDGVHLFAPQSTYGGPRGLRRLVDACHAAGLSLILDVVYNHLGPEGNYLAEFGPYFTDRHPTPWGPGVNVDGPDAAGVRRHLVDNARYWVREFHVDGLRLDAIHAITDTSALHILTELARAAREEAMTLGRPLHVIAESHDNDRRLVLPAAGGGLGLDAVWSDDFHHALHARLTGERVGYYADYPGGRGLERAIAAGFVYQGESSVYWGRNRGTPSSDLPGERFVISIQNHDQVGNRPGSERLPALVHREAVKAAVAILCATPAIPLLFMGEEYGETSPFPFFASFLDPHLSEAVHRGRQRELDRFGGTGRVADPSAPATFARARLNHALVVRPGHRELREYYRAWLTLRGAHPALGACRKQATDAEIADDVLLVNRQAATGERVVLAANLADERRSLPRALAGATVLLDSGQPRFGGRAGIPLAPYQAVLFEIARSR